MDAIFAHYPYQTASFFRSIISFGFWTGFGLSIPTLYVLSDPDACGSACDLYLRRWVLVRMLVFLCQTPFRVMMFSQLQDAIATVDRNVAVQKLISLCHSRPWQINQIMGVFLYCWFMLAIVMLLFVNECGSTFLYRLCVANIGLFFLHMLFSFVWLRSILTHDASSWNDGATQAVIDLCTRMVKYVRDNAQCSKMSVCAICISDYVDADDVRVLPCSHDYHSDCIDAWLTKKKVCPLCQRAIDAPPPIIADAQSMVHDLLHPRRA